MQTSNTLVQIDTCGRFVRDLTKLICDLVYRTHQVTTRHFTIPEALDKTFFAPTGNQLLSAILNRYIFL